jgi:hypothetical protein
VRVLVAISAIAAIALSSGCAKPARDDAATVHFKNGVALALNTTCLELDCRTYRTAPYVRTQSRFGVGCLGNVPPGATANPQPPPQSYLVADLGKPGVPRLNRDESATLARIRRYVTSATLRIAWVDSSNNDKLIIFDARDGPCVGYYPVLNGTCNEIFEPEETPYHTIPTPECLGTPRPWDQRSR